MNTPFTMPSAFAESVFRSLLMLLLVPVLWTGSAQCEPTDTKMVLARAVMCESIESYQPVNPGVVFSVTNGEIFCFTEFDPVYEETRIFHRWYKQDKLIFTMRLVLSPPKWSSFSRVQTREADKAPWRVEIQDEAGNLIKTLRFSMTD